MTEKQIEKINQAAREYINSEAVKPENMQLAYGDFINGAKWYANNQWHNASIDKPDLSCPIFAHLSIDGLSILKYRNPQTLNVVMEPHKHYCDMSGEEVPVSIIKYWMEIPELKQE